MFWFRHRSAVTTRGGELGEGGGGDARVAHMSRFRDEGLDRATGTARIVPNTYNFSAINASTN